MIRSFVGLEKLKLSEKEYRAGNGHQGEEWDLILPKPYLSALAENPPMNTDELAL